MKKPLQYIIYIFILGSCSSNNQGQAEQEKLPDDSAVIDTTLNIEEDYFIDLSAQIDSAQFVQNKVVESSLISYVRTHTSTRSDTLDFKEAFPYDRNYHRLPNKYRDQLNTLPLQNANTRTLVVDQYERYNLIDYFEDSSFFYFRILIDDEYCCRSLYVVTLNKSDEQIHNISFLGLKGGDGGWGEFDTEYWISDSSLLYVKLSTYDEDIHEDGYQRTTDSMIVKYTIRNGSFAKELLDSVHYEQKISSN